MKFVFALALVAVCVMLMRARPNVIRRDAEIGDETKQKGFDSSEENKMRADSDSSEESKMRTDSDSSEEKKNNEGSDSEENKLHPNAEAVEEEIEGEAVAGIENNEKSSRKKRAATDPEIHLWPKDSDGNINVPYKFSPASYGDKEKCKKGVCETLSDLVQTAADEWNLKAGVNIHLAQGATDYVIEIKSGIGCWSWIGYQGRGPGNNVMVLEEDGCYNVGVILHELGHALGLMHEAKRNDRDDYINISDVNIEPSMLDQFTIDPNAVPIESSIFHADEESRDYDYCSIMHYSDKAFSKNGQTTIQLRDIAIQRDTGQHEPLEILPCLGSQLALSLRDGIGVAALYDRLEPDQSPTDCKYGGYKIRSRSACVCSNLFEGDTCQTPISDSLCGTSVFELGDGDVATFKTPNFGGNNEYPENKRCTWAISSPPDGKICIAFPNGYQLEQAATSGVCAFDWIELLFDRYLTLKTRRFCGISDNGWYEIFDDADFAAIVFNSDDFGVANGFQGAVVALPGTLSEDGAKEQCRSIIESTSGLEWGNPKDYDEYEKEFGEAYWNLDYYYYYD